MVEKETPKQKAVDKEIPKTTKTIEIQEKPVKPVINEVVDQLLNDIPVEMPEENIEPVKEKNVSLEKPKQQDLSKLESFTTLEGAENFARYLFYTNLAPKSFDTPKDAAVALMYGQELGVKPMSSLNNIHVVGGRCGLSVGIYTSKLMEEGIYYDILEDYKPIITYALKGGKLTEEEYLLNPDDYQIVTLKTETTKYKAEKVQVIKSIEDYRTKIKFTRYVKLPTGEFHKWVIEHSILYSEIVQMGLVKEGSSWVKQPRTMLRTRVLTAGARLIAPEKFHNMYSKDELLDIEGKNYKVDDVNGEVIEVEEVK